MLNHYETSGLSARRCVCPEQTKHIGLIWSRWSVELARIGYVAWEGNSLQEPT